MKRKERTKEITGREPNYTNRIMTKPQAYTADTTENPVIIKYQCIRDCEVMGVGIFRAGEIIDAEKKVSRIAGNPNFERI